MGDFIRIGRDRLINVKNPDPRSFNADDIARGLSRIARFNGHAEANRRITVAEHSVNVAFSVLDAAEKYLSGKFSYCLHLGNLERLFERNVYPSDNDDYITRELRYLGLGALFHDGHEFIVTDIATPVKEDIGRENIRPIAHRLDMAIGMSVGVPAAYMEMKPVKAADAELLNLESDWLFEKGDQLYVKFRLRELASKRGMIYRRFVIGKPKIGLSPAEAEHTFIEAYRQISSLRFRNGAISYGY